MNNSAGSINSKISAIEGLNKIISSNSCLGRGLQVSVKLGDDEDSNPEIRFELSGSDLKPIEALVDALNEDLHCAQVIAKTQAKEIQKAIERANTTLDQSPARRKIPDVKDDPECNTLGLVRG